MPIFTGIKGTLIHTKYNEMPISAMAVTFALGEIALFFSQLISAVPIKGWR